MKFWCGNQFGTSCQIPDIVPAEDAQEARGQLLFQTVNPNSHTKTN